jgi:hypothetical protein
MFCACHVKLNLYSNLFGKMVNRINNICFKMYEKKKKRKENLALIIDVTNCIIS